ncbi:hypothetical protein CR970_00625 [Candidatus Saccharibacteria bacterium]|nr:MAG: hypothetical protein CR970_00625 [Candidatus Saccharibacteria bacterium]
MNKLQLTHPTLILLYGYPGSGKTFFARQVCQDIQAAHVQGDRIRAELFEQPRFDRQENEIVANLMNYMAGEFLASGISVVYDMNAMRISQRRALRDMARRHQAKTLLVWLQIDFESAFGRNSRRDHRKADDRYAAQVDQATFNSILGGMQNPEPTEDYVVISGKHTYQTQRGGMMRKLYEVKLLSSQDVNERMVRPELVNLVPKATGGRVDQSRRNIFIR